MNDSRPLREAEQPTLGASSAGDPARDVRVHVRGQDPPAPVAIGHFRVVARLGAGGMGVVYRAHDPALDREVAIKLVGAGEDATGRARLVREAQALAKVKHPNVVHVHEVAIVGDDVFLVMELVDGATTVDDWLEERPRGWREICELMVAVGRGLAAAHAVGIVHRDVKPDNVMVGRDGRPRLVDFGLARSVDAGQDDGAGGSTGTSMAVTRAGALVGTPAYMAPEQWEGGAVGPACDQFALAVMLHRALFRSPPFAGDDIPSLWREVVAGRLQKPPPSEVPSAIAAIVARGLATDPADRWPSVDAFVDALAAELALDPDADVERGRRIRIAFAAIVALQSLNRVRIVLQDGVGAIDLDALLLQAVAACLAMLALAVVLRKQIVATSYNRRAIALFFFGALALVVHRALMLRLGAAVQHVLIGDATMILGLTGLGAVTVDRRLAPVVVLALAASIASALSSIAAAIAFPLLTGACGIVMILLWRGRTIDTRAPPRTGSSKSARSSTGGSGA